MSSPYIRRQVGRRPGQFVWAGMSARRATPSPIDKMARAFRDRWETNADYRKRMSITLGGAALSALCLIVAVVAVVASGTLGVGGPPGAGGLAQSGGVGQLQQFTTFPTPSLPAWTPGTIPGAPPAPESQTPMPQPTKPGMPTPTDSGTTPTIGGLPTTCNGNIGSTTWTIQPCPLQAGQGGSFSIHAPSHANAPVNVLINFGICAGNVNCTYTFLPSANHLNGSGDITLGFTVPAAAANNSAPVSGMVNIQGGPSFSFTAAPVQ